MHTPKRSWTVLAELDTTQARISTGYRVGSAEDNAAYWSIATTMRSDNGALSTVKDALGLGAATIDVAYTGMNSSIEIAKQIKNKLVAARQPGIDRAKVQSEVSELQNQLLSISSSSVFSGENWLSVDSSLATYNSTKSIVASFSRAGGVHRAEYRRHLRDARVFRHPVQRAGPDRSDREWHGHQDARTSQPEDG